MKENMLARARRLYTLSVLFINAAEEAFAGEKGTVDITHGRKFVAISVIADRASSEKARARALPASRGQVTFLKFRYERRAIRHGGSPFARLY